MQKITLKKIKSFLTGYSRYAYNNLVGLPDYQQEQIIYRAQLCKNDCAVKGSCIVCGCDFPAKLFAYETCNPGRFPSIMEEDEWKEFKERNSITITDE
jgi:hypothetical protein